VVKLLCMLYCALYRVPCLLAISGSPSVAMFVQDILLIKFLRRTGVFIMEVPSRRYMWREATAASGFTAAKQPFTLLVDSKGF
jgi:hypothetical protein